MQKSDSQPLANTAGTCMLSLRNVDQVMRWWHFFRAGLEVINRDTAWQETREDFFRMMMHVLKIGERKGLILVHIDKCANPLGFLLAADNSAPFGKKSVLVYAVYSNKLCPSSFMELIAEVAAWAKTGEYQQVQAVSYKLNRVAVKLFKRHLPDRKFMVFTKDLSEANH